ncbi:hypothetical protein E2C01_021475 [Portunus trituberculatus]|uniref:Uncharacterized protein n=1 Tax=Portunus trituberculatus TaxID=210409 RepID=A0A5B7E4H3_PORTR|nr:hypothetical protein [Portunus trituberculatus]
MTLGTPAFSKSQQNTGEVIKCVSFPSLSLKKFSSQRPFLSRASDVSASLSSGAKALRKAFFVGEFMANGSSVSVRATRRPSHYPHQGVHAATSFIISILKPLSVWELEEI